MRSKLMFAIMCLILSSPSWAAGNDLDDISIQVIGLDDIPEDALERIPLPEPGIGDITNIKEGILLNQPPPSVADPVVSDTIDSGGGGTIVGSPTEP